MSSLNSWSFTGNIGKDCELRVTPKGDNVVSFSVAVKSGYGDKETTSWARCTIWGKRAESLSQYLKKGQLVGITGEVSLRDWEGKDGAKGTSLEVNVDNLALLGKAPTNQETPSEPQPKKQAKQVSNSIEDMMDDLPF